MFFASAVRATVVSVQFVPVPAKTGTRLPATATASRINRVVISQGPWFTGRPRNQQARYATVDLPFGEFGEGRFVQLIAVKGRDEIADSAVWRGVDPGAFTHFQFPFARLRLSAFDAQTVWLCG
jgi:hypothetical protein